LSDPQFWIQMLRRITLLQPPRVDGAFEEIVWRTLNGSTWTIGYEFRCYLLVVVLGLCGVLRRPGLLMALFIGILMSNFWVLNSAIQLPQPALWLAALVGRPDASLQLTSYFLAGAVLWSVPSVLASCRRAYPLLAFPLAASLATPAWADLGLATVGAIVVIALALDDRPAARWMRHVNARQDVSYGVYLYAWPCTAILIHLAPGLGLNALLMATVALSLLFGAMSWFCVERPVLNLVRARRG
jgi:peptidoglycan/LPS O-acetylase OafA/YrhL